MYILIKSQSASNVFFFLLEATKSIKIFVLMVMRWRRKNSAPNDDGFTCEGSVLHNH